MADRKISDLTALTTPASGDYLPIVDISEAAAASKNKRITIEELMRGVPDGTAAAPGIAFETDPNTGIYSPGADQLAVATNGTGRLFITSTGLVGVGVSAPGQLLEIHGASNPAALVKNTTSNVQAYFYASATAGIFGTPTLHPLVFNVENLEKARIDTSGRLGIGTSSPQQELHINDATGVSRIRLTGGAVGADSFEIGQAIQGVSNTGFSIYDVEATASRLVIDSSGNVGIGTTSPSFKLHISGTGNSGAILTEDTTAATSLYFNPSFTTGVPAVQTGTNHPLAFATNNVERARIDTSGRLLVGTSSASEAARAILQGNSFSSSGGCIFKLSRGNATPNDGGDLGNLQFTDSNHVYAANISAKRDGGTWTSGSSQPTRLEFSTTADGASSPTERMRIDRSGFVDIGGYGNAGLLVTTPVGTPLQLNRTVNDGELVRFKQDGTTEGNITVSGTTVSYNGAHLARWSQLASGAERTEILRGSVLSNLDEMCEWSEEDNEQLNRMKVSDVEGDPNVSGVFQAWDDDDDTYTDDFYCAMTGDFVIRIAEGVTVERGDLLMSAGDGTAKPQDDDIIRSKTIAKVTSTNVSCTYADGSYCVPCVLMAC
jgi:hypothetical protein